MTRPAPPSANDESAGLPCREEDPDLWFGEHPDQAELAKALCTRCPVREACLTGALERREPWGVWGGELFAQGVVIARKAGRGRPRKQPAAVLISSVEYEDLAHLCERVHVVAGGRIVQTLSGAKLNAREVAASVYA